MASFDEGETVTEVKPAQRYLAMPVGEDSVRFPFSMFKLAGNKLKIR